MSKTEILGKIAFINHEKKYAMIEYEQNGKKKTVKGNIDEKTPERTKREKAYKKNTPFCDGRCGEF